MICGCNRLLMSMAGWFWGLSVTKCYNSGKNSAKKWEEITQLAFLPQIILLPQTHKGELIAES
jgi:hypothetical protein